MMIRNFLDLLQVLIKQNAKSNIKRQNSRLLIYDIYLKKYVNADELLIPSPTKESIKHLDNWEKSQSSPLFDLLLKKFVNPKLDLLCPTEQKFIPRGWDCSTVQGCRYASTLKGFWESGSGDNSRYPALPSSKDDVDRDQEEVGWAGQATGKPESNPRPERSSLLVAIKNPEKIGRKSQKLSKPIERVVKNANNMYKDGAPMPERRSDKNKQTLSTISQKPEKVSVPEKTPQTEKSNVKLSFYKGVGNDKKAEIRNRGELLKVKLPNNGKLLQLKKMCTQMFSIKKSKEREDGIKKNSLQEKTVIGTDSKVLFQDEQTFVENDTTEKDMVMNGKECQKDSQCLRTENNISISNNCSTEYKSAMKDKEHPNNKENVVSAKDMELTTKSFETTNRDHLSKMEINVRESTQDSDLNLRTNSDPQICKNKNMNMLKHNRNYLMKVTSNLTNVVTTVNCSIKNEKTGCEKKHDTRVINDEKKLTIEAKANTLVNNTHLKNKFKSQSQHLLNEHKKSSQEPSQPDKTIPFEELHNSLVLSSPKLESSLHDCDNNVIGQGECQNSVIHTQNNQKVVPENKLADIEATHPIKSGQSGVISFIEVKKEGLPHTNPVGNESPSLNQDDKFKFQNNQAVVPKNKQADIEAAHPIKSGQSGVISFIEVKKEGLPHTNPVGNESPSLNQNDKLKFQNNQAVVPKNKQADIETAHPIKKGQLGVISCDKCEAKKESSPCKNVGNKNPLVQQDKELKFQNANSDDASSFISESITHNSNQKQTQNQNLLLLPKTSDSDTTELTGIENPTKNNTYFTSQSKVRTKKDNEVKDSNAVKIHNMERKTIEKLRVISAEGKYLDNLTLDGELGQYNVTKYKGFKIVNSHSAVQEKKSLPIQTTSQKGLNSQLACTDNIISEKTVKLGTTESKSPQNNYQIKAVDSHVALQSKTPKNVKVKRNNNNKIIEQLRSFNGQKMAESKNIQPEPITEDCSKVTKEVLKPKVVNKSLIEKSAANIVNPVDPKKIQMNTTKGNIENETTMLRPSENIKINNCIEENKQDDINKCGRRKHIKPTMFKYLTKKQRKNKNLKEQQEFKNINGKKEHQSVTFHLKNANLKTQRKVALRSKSVENVASINIHEKGNIVKSKSIVPLHLSQKSNFNKVVDGSSNGEQIQNLETKVTIEKGVRNTKTNLLPSNQSSLNGKQKISIPKQSPVSSQSKKNFVGDNLRTEKNLPTVAPKISTNVINSIPYSNINKSNKNVGMKQIKVLKSENFKISKSNQESKLSVTPKQENEVTDKTTKLSKIKLENGSTNSVALKCQNKQNFDVKNQNLPKTSGVQQKSKVNHAILKHKDLNNNNNNNRENNSLINTVHSEDQIKVVRRKEIISRNNKETLNRKQSLNSLKLISRGKPLNATENIIEKNTLNNTGFDGTKTKTAKIRQPTQENINFNQDNGFQDKRYLQKSVSNNTEDIKVSSKKDIDMNLTPTSKVLNKKYSTTDIKTVPNAQTITTGYKDLDRSKIIKKKLSNATANEYQNESLLRDQKENIGESALISKIKNNAMQRSIKLEDYIKRNVNNVIINSKAVSHAQQKNSIRNANLNLQDSTKFSNKKLSTEEGEKCIRGIHKSKNYLENKSSTLVAETKGPDKIKRNTTDLPLKTVKDKSIKSGKNCKTEKTEECELAALQRAEDQNIIEQPSTGIPANNLKLTSLYSRQNSNKPKSPVKQQANMMIKPNEPSTTKQIVIQKSNVEDHCSKITNVLKSDRQDLNTPKSGKVGSSTKIIPEKECNIKDQSTENPNQYKITMQKMYKGQNVKETVKVTNFEGPLKPLSGKSRPKTPNSITQSLEPHKKVDELLNYPHSLSNNSKKVSNKNNESLDLLLNTRQIELHTKLQTNSKFKITDIKNKTGSSKDLNVQETCNKAQQESVKKLPEEKIGRKGEGLTDQKNLIQGSSRKIYTQTTNKNNTTRNCGVTANQLRNVPISSKYGRKTLGSSQNNSQGSEETKNLIKTAKETIDFKDKMNSGVQNEKSETFKEDIRLKELLNHFCCQQNNGNDSGVMSCQSTYVRNNEHKDNNKKLLMDESKRPFKNNIKNFDTTNLSKQNNCTVSLDKEMLKLSLKNDEEAKFRKNHSLKSNHKQTVERIDNDGRTKSSSSSKKKESI